VSKRRFIPGGRQEVQRRGEECAKRFGEYQIKAKDGSVVARGQLSRRQMHFLAMENMQAKR
jgi:hypothetical protein